MFEEIIALKTVKDIAKKVVTKENAKFFWFLYKRYLVNRAEHFASYKVKMLDSFENINSTVQENAQIKLADVYVPQCIVNESTHDEVIIDGFPKTAVRRHRCIVIKDYAGRGKSTLLKQMFVGAVNEGMFPLFVVLRNLNDGHGLIKEILETLIEINDNFNERLLRSLLKQGDFVIFLDGLDEVNVEMRESVTKDIKKLVDGTRNNYFVMTSRNDDALTGFGDFQGYTIKDFTLEQACELIGKYDNHGLDSERLIRELHDGAHQEVAEFLKSPLHTALFYKVFAGRAGVPYKLHEVCDEIFQSLYNMHDLAKDGYYEHQKKCNLSVNDYMKVLGSLAIQCLTSGHNRMSRTEMKRLFEIIKNQDGELNFNDEDMIYDLVVALSLFKYKGQDLCWIHEAMCNFFAANNIRMDRSEPQSIILKRFYESQRLAEYEQVIRMYGEMEPGEFRKYFLSLLLDDMRTQYVQMLSHARSGINAESLHARCYYMFSSVIESEQKDGTWFFYSHKKTKKFVMEILYRQMGNNYHLQTFPEDMPENYRGESGTKKKMSINSFSDNQTAYDYVNGKAAEIIGFGNNFLNLDDITLLHEHLSQEVLASESPNLFQNI